MKTERERERDKLHILTDKEVNKYCRFLKLPHIIIIIIILHD